MSIKSDNAELKQKIDALKSSNDVSNFISDISSDISNYQKYYNSFVEIFSANRLKESDIRDSIKQLDDILLKYQCPGIRAENFFNYFSGSGGYSGKNYNDVVNSLFSKVNSATKALNDKIDLVKSTSGYYKEIAKNIGASANSLSSASSQYNNNEIEVNGDKKLAHFRKETKETSESFIDLKNVINDYANKINELKKIDIKDFSVSIETGDTK